MIASLPMYDRPCTRDANDRYWTAIRKAYGRGPETLNRSDDPHDTWFRSDLVFSQTCGLPYRSVLHGKVHLLGTPDYGLDDCPPGYYCSRIIVAADDPRDDIRQFARARLARNDKRSQSGWAAIVEHMRARHMDCDLSTRAVDTGSHAASLRAVVNGSADFAAVDAVTWALLDREPAKTDGLRVLESTEPTPGLPYIASLGEDQEKLHDAIDAAIATLADPDREQLMLRGLVRIPASTYLSVPLP